MTMAIPLVDEWDPKVDDLIMYVEEKTAIINFLKVFDMDLPKSICTFIIGKKSYLNQMVDTIKENRDKTLPDKKIRGICHYNNYFLNYYDVDGELMTGYLRLKMLIDGRTKKLRKKQFIKLVSETFLTPSMIEKVDNMVEHNYILKSPTSNKGFAEQLAFTEKHIKILMNISVMMKLMLPVVTHYIHMCGKGELNLVYEFFLPLFTKLNKDVDIYNKLWISINAKINSSLYQHRTVWGFHAIFSEWEPDSKTDELFREHVIGEAMLRYVFSDSPVVYTSVFLDTHLFYFFREDFKMDNIVVVDSIRDSEGLSGMDKMEINSSKIDESIPIMSKLNVEFMMDKFRNKIKVKDMDKEIEFYLKNHRIDPFQSQLVHTFYADHFGGYRDLDMLNTLQYVELMILLKYYLINKGFVYIPQILSGNVTQMNRRVIRNKKFLSKIEESDIFRNLVEKKFTAIMELGKDNYIIGILSKMINSDFDVVDYHTPDKLGERLEIDNLEVISHEFLNFLAMV